MQFALPEVGNTICLDTSVQKTTGHAGKGISLKAVTDYMICALGWALKASQTAHLEKLPLPEGTKDGNWIDSVCGPKGDKD